MTKYKISEINQLAPDIINFILLPDVEKITYHAGQYIEILCPDGNWLPFSIANAPVKNGKKELIIRQSNDEPSLKKLLASVKIGAELNVRGPFGDSVYSEKNKEKVLLLAGGTGVAPIKAILESVDRAEFHLYWGVRHSREFYLDKQITHWLDAGVLKTFTPVVSGDEKNWSGLRGWVHEHVVAHHPDLRNVKIYASGPMAMIKSAVDLYPEYGHDISMLYSDMLPYLQYA